ncbi:MAG: Transcriptional regulatory protein TyrR [Candidatus Celerinatantimonas neptuna]|nr:MAG: Transcriptional regulatory protein TyrR [Candidatus Celerinatantimonas neptuna]
MIRLEIVCPCGIEVISRIFEILTSFNVVLKGIETNTVGYLYLVISDVEFSQLQSLLTKLRYIDVVCDARVLRAIPSELEHREVQLLLNTISAPVILVDRDGVISQVNEAFAFACCCPREQLISQPFSEYIKGFSLGRWLGSGQGRSESAEVYLGERPYQAQIEPLAEESSVLNLPTALMILHPDSCLVPDLDLSSIRDSFAPFGLIAHHPSYLRVVEQIKQVAEQSRPLLLYGEIGSGRKFSAQLLNHFRGNSPEQMVCIDGLISDTILDEQLLDIVVDLPEMVLVRQIEKLQPAQFSRLISQLHSVTQVVYTSSLPPGELIDRFGSDMFYSGISQCLEILPLRMRLEDIIPLVQAWLDEEFLNYGQPSPTLTKSVQQFIKKCSWPGNIAQLLQVLRDTMSITGPRAWTVKDIQYSHQSESYSIDLNGILDHDYHQAMSEFERLLLNHHYPHYPSTRSLAKKLGLSHTAVAKKLKEHKIT